MSAKAYGKVKEKYEALKSKAQSLLESFGDSVAQIESKLPQEVRMVGVTVKKRSPDLLMVLNLL